MHQTTAPLPHQDAAEPVPARTSRYWELDVLRCLALVMMICYHTVWDTASAHRMTFLATTGFWYGFQQTTASLFIGLVGVGMTLTRARAPATSAWRLFAPRAMLIFGLAMLLSGLALASGIGRIDFGVLHLIGMGMILGVPFLDRPWLAAALAIPIIAIGVWIRDVHLETLAWVPLGIHPRSYPRLDFIPLLPWFGAVLLGIVVGRWWYPGGQRRWVPPDLSRCLTVRFAAFLGRHSLAVYLIHQPILFGLLMLTGVMPSAPRL